jgi:cell division protein ZipA
MEFREIIIVLGLVAIGLIVWDGTRRMKRPAQKEKNEPYIDPEEAARRAQLERELPNGGARVREMTVDEKVQLKSKINFRERVPMLMERVEVQRDDESTEVEPQVQAELDFSAAMREPDDEVYEPSSASDDPATDVETNQEPLDLAVDQPEVADDEPLDDVVEQDIQPVIDEIPKHEPEPVAPAPTETPQTKAEPEPQPQEDYDVGPVEDLVIIHVMASDNEELSGSRVLDLLVTAGLRHGPMDIFHYRNPKGVTEFSLVNCVHPGTFDPDAMNQLNTPGVTLFMQLPTAADAMEAFDHMYEMAVFLAKHLDARILDEDHSTVTPQRIEYYREKLRTFARAKLLSH